MAIGAYEEWLDRNVFIIRGAKGALRYPDPWDSEVIALVVRWWEFWKPNEPRWAKRGRGYVIFKGFVGTGFGGKKPTREYIEAAVGLSNRLCRLPVRWMQKKPGKDSYWLFQTHGVNGGRIIMKASKHGVPHVSAAMKNGKPDFVAIKDVVKTCFQLAHHRHIYFRGAVEVSDNAALSAALGSMSLADNEFFLGAVRHGDAAAAGVPKLTDTMNADGTLDVHKLEAGTNKGIAALESGKLSLVGSPVQVGTTEELHALASQITLGEGDEFLGFVRVEN